MISQYELLSMLESNTGIVCVFLFFSILELFFPFNRQQIFFNKRILNKLLWVVVIFYGVNRYTGELAHQLVSPLSSVAIVPWISQWNIWQKCAAYAVFFDLGSYLLHRVYHTVPFFWELHKVHHATHEFDWSLSFKQHPLDQFFFDIYDVFLIIIFQLSPFAILCFGLFTFIWGTQSHTNFSGRLSFLDGFLNTSHNHRIHHERVTHFRGGQNFGAWTIIWDRVFGTYINPKDFPAHESDLGFKGDDTYPSALWQQMLQPFKVYFKINSTRDR